MIRLTVEEMNLLSIYHEGSKAQLMENMTAALPFMELFKTEDKKRCTECGTFFVSKSNSVKYCPDCRKRITRRQAAERMRKRRAAVTR